MRALRVYVLVLTALVVLAMLATCGWYAVHP